MKTVILRFIVAAVLVLSSISVCLSNDNGCDDRPGYSQSTKTSSDSSSNDQGEDHHCICSLSCNNMFVQYSTESSKISSIIIPSVTFQYIQVTYPQVLLLLDKPPII